MRLGDLTTDEVPRDALMAIPVGSCEQHGPHLPLDTDTRIAVALADALVERLAGSWPMVVAPPIAITSSGEHAGFAGTLSVGIDVTKDIFVEVVRSADRFAGVVFVHGHGGNVEAARRADDACRGDGRRCLHWFGSPVGADAHAGRFETSVMLHLDGSSVRRERVEPGVTMPIAELLPRLRAEGVAAVSANGILGDPRGSSADEGASMFASLVDDLVDAVTRWRATW